MHWAKLFTRLGVAALLATPLGAAEEKNEWPVRVVRFGDSGQVQSWQGAGPLFFSQPEADGGRAYGFRPFFVTTRSPDGTASKSTFLYPLFIRRSEPGYRRWSVFQLINSTKRTELGTAPRGDSGFDIWPFYFSRDTGSPETSYSAFFPVFGTVTQRLFNERATWVLAPLFVRTENKGVRVTSAPWPFIRIVSGAENSGFSLWPLFGMRRKPGVYHREFYLWPLVHNDVSHLDGPEPVRSFGVLPFYARQSGPGMKSETYAWPFLGYVDLTEPYRYHETRYFWPLFVQGRGDDHYRNRWAPFYTHSVIKGLDKTWVLWPLYRRDSATDAGIQETKTRVLYFIYTSRVQRSAANPDIPPASKSGLWPLYSAWNDGAGRRQFQALSPFEAFFPGNDNVRVGWSPLFALYRRDQKAPGDVRHSVLFDLATWHRSQAGSEFHLGPLLGVESGTAGARVALAGGLIGLKRAASGKWRPFWFDFSHKDRDSPPSP